MGEPGAGPCLGLAGPAAVAAAATDALTAGAPEALADGFRPAFAVSAGLVTVAAVSRLPQV